MSDYDLPDLPSDEELGITDEDREKYGDELSGDRPEMTPDEMAALLGETPPPRRSKRARRKAKASSSGDAGRAAEGPGGEQREGHADAKRGGDGGEAPAAAPASEGPKVAAVAEGPRSRWLGPVTLALLLAVAVVSSSRTGLPRPVPASAADTAFSSARAMTQLVEIARLPHPIGSPEHERVRRLLVDRLDDLGLQPETQTATAMGQVTGMARGATVRNIVGRLPGTASTGAVLIAAHYDSRELSPGAADDGAGVVTILEAVRALRAGPQLRNDVIVLVTDGEEPCLCGAQAFTEQHPWMEDVSVVLNFEMRGSAGPSIMFETNDRNGWIVRELQATDPPPFANSMAYEVYRRMPNNTDFTLFKEAGKQGLNFAALDRAWTYHQATDRPENLSEATLQHHGTSALTMLRRLGDADLSAVDAPNTVYVTVPLIGLVVYDARWVLPISGVLLALALVAVLAARTRGARVAGIVTGAGVALLGAAFSFGVALWLGTWITGFYAEAGSLSGSVLYREGWWILAAASASFFVVTTLHGVARRWLGLAELSLGALVVPLALMLWVSVAFPLGALNLQWPLAAALVAVVIVGLLGPRASATVGWLATVALAVPVLALLVPIIELVWLAMTAQLIGGVAVLVAVTLHLTLPALDSLRHPNSWWAPLTGVLAGAACFGVAVSTSSPSEDRPGPSTLVYAYEHGTGSALWATDPNADATLDAEAVEWAAQRAGTTFSRTRDMSDFGYPPGPMPVADAPRVAAPPPEVQVRADSIEGVVRRVTLGVRSNVGAELLRFQLEPTGRTQILSMNGAAIDSPDSLQWVEHYGVPDSTGVLLELRMPADQPIGLYVVEHLLRPWEILGPEPLERPADLMPDATAMSDRAAFRYSVAAYADPRHAFMPGVVGQPGAATHPGAAIQPEADTRAAPDTQPEPAELSTSAAPAGGPDAVPDAVPDAADSVGVTGASNDATGR